MGRSIAVEIGKAFSKADYNSGIYYLNNLIFGNFKIYLNFY
jgi:hypothetical protein